MPNCNNSVKTLRLKAGLSQNGLSRLADLDRGTISKAENKIEVSELTVSKIASALSEKLGKEITFGALVSQESVL